MRIVFISLYNYAPWGGSEDLWVQTAALAAKEGHDVLASVFDFGKNNSKKILNLKNYGVILHYRKRIDSYDNLIKKAWLFFKNRIKFLKNDFKAIIDFKPDIIFINDPGTFIYIREYKELQFLIERNKLVYAIVCKLTPDYGVAITDELRHRAKIIFENAKKMFFVSHRMQKNIERFLATRIENSMIIQNPVNLETREIIEFPNEDSIGFAVVSHLGVAHKGQDVLMEILSNDFWREKNWTLNLYGEGSDKHYLKNLANFFCIADKVFFHGYVDKIQDIWLKNHIMLHPSTSEGMSKAIEEAMMCGRLVVAADVGGNSELVIENKTGFIADAPSVSSFDKAMRRAWERRKNWKDLGIYAHNFINNWLNEQPEKTLLDALKSYYL